MAKNCLVDSRLFKTRRSGRINLRTTVNLSEELGLSEKQVRERYGRYAGCVGLQALEQEQRRNNMQEPVLAIDGRPAKNPYGAKFPQKITYIDKNVAQIGNVAIEILKRLISVSPVGPAKPPFRRTSDGTIVGNPHYWDCHLLLVNGREPLPKDDFIKPTDTVQIVNTIIYAKRIEQGWSMEAPSGVYRPVMSWAKRLFGVSFKISWGYMPLGNVPQNKVRRYDFPRVKPGMRTAMFSGRNNLGVGTYKKSGTFNFVTKHSAATSRYGYKTVGAVFPYIELAPKEIALAVGQGSLQRTSIKL